MSHEQLIINHLKRHDHITMLEALGVYRIFNLRGRISDLRKKGYKIHTEMKRDATGKTYAAYSLIDY